jgi:hypothetical protein
LILLINDLVIDACGRIVNERRCLLRSKGSHREGSSNGTWLPTQIVSRPYSVAIT